MNQTYQYTSMDHGENQGETHCIIMVELWFERSTQDTEHLWYCIAEYNNALI